MIQFAQQCEAQNKLNEGLVLMQLAVEFYPDRAWLWNNFAGMQERSGNIPDAIRSAEKVTILLTDDKGAEQSFNQRILRSSQERLQRLKK